MQKNCWVICLSNIKRNIVIDTILVLQEEYPAYSQPFNQKHHGIAGHSRASFNNSDFLESSEISQKIHQNFSENSSEIRPFVDYMTPEHVSNYARVPNDDSDFGATKHQNGGYSCHYCSKFMKDKNDMRRHIRTHTREKLFQCSFCGKSFIQKNNLKVHMLSVHKYVANK